MPPVERDFLIMCGHISNEILILGKTIMASQNFPTEKIALRIALAQSVFFARLLAGKLYEAWGALDARYFSTQLSKKYDGVMEKDAEIALEGLRKYFGKSTNAIKLIRNSYSSHYTKEDLQRGLDAISEPDELSMYLSQCNVNSFYYMSDIILNRVMFDKFYRSDLSTAFNKMYKEIVQVQGWMIEFMSHAIMTVSEKYIDISEGRVMKGENNYSSCPKPDDLRMPIFIDIS